VRFFAGELGGGFGHHAQVVRVFLGGRGIRLGLPLQDAAQGDRADPDGLCQCLRGELGLGLLLFEGFDVVDRHGRSIGIWAESVRIRLGVRRWRTAYSLQPSLLFAGSRCSTFDFLLNTCSFHFPQGDPEVYIFSWACCEGPIGSLYEVVVGSAFQLVLRVARA